MYNWLYSEISTINTRKYHLTNLPLENILAEDVQTELLPPSYLDFVNKFGHSKLYREGVSYLLHLFEQPRYTYIVNGIKYIQFASVSQLTLACFRLSDVMNGDEAHVFEIFYIDGSFEVESTESTFFTWLLRCADEIKSSMGQDEWKKIVEGPSPFSSEETTLVEERENFVFSLVGFTNDGYAQILVENNSSISLPYLTIGVIDTADNSSVKTIWLPIHGLQPGEDILILHNMYRGFIDQKNVNLVKMPQPEPEDREAYWEFKSHTV